METFLQVIVIITIILILTELVYPYYVNNSIPKPTEVNNGLIIPYLSNMFSNDYGTGASSSSTSNSTGASSGSTSNSTGASSNSTSGDSTGALTKPVVEEPIGSLIPILSGLNGVEGQLVSSTPISTGLSNDILKFKGVDNADVNGNYECPIGKGNGDGRVNLVVANLPNNILNLNNLKLTLSASGNSTTGDNGGIDVNFMENGRRITAFGIWYRDAPFNYKINGTYDLTSNLIKLIEKVQNVNKADQIIVQAKSCWPGWNANIKNVSLEVGVKAAKV